MDATAVRSRRLPVLVLGVAALVAWLVMAVLVGGGGAGACNPPPPGYHWQPAPWTYLWGFGPGLLTFMVTAYLALGVRRVWLRWLLLVPCLALAWAVTFVAVVTMPFSCGMWVPN
jgi:hypothetical protein